MKRSSVLKLALAAGAAGAAAAGAGLAMAGRRWAAADDDDAAARLTLPEGTEIRVPTPDDGEIAATVSGSADGGGRTFVLVHGWVNDRRIWAPVAHILAERGHHVVLYDQRGHGASRVGSDGHTIEALGTDMNAVLEHLDARDAIVAGHSMGGMAAQAFAIEHPDTIRKRVAGVALVSTASTEVGIPGPRRKVAGRFLASSRINRFVSHAHLGPVFMRGTFGKQATMSGLRIMQETFVATEGTSRRGFLEAMSTMDLTEGLSTVDVPVLVLSGTRDGLVAHSSSRRLAEAINGARFEVFTDFGHMLPLETPDRVADLLEDLALSGTTQQRSAASA